MSVECRWQWGRSALEGPVLEESWAVLGPRSCCTASPQGVASEGCTDREEAPEGRGLGAPRGPGDRGRELGCRCPTRLSRLLVQEDPHQWAQPQDSEGPHDVTWP